MDGDASRHLILIIFIESDVDWYVENDSAVVVVGGCLGGAGGVEPIAVQVISLAS